MAHLPMVVEEGHLGRLEVAAELASIVARKSSIQLGEVEVGLHHSHSGHNLVDNHHSHSLEEAEVEELVVAKEQHYHPEEHNCCNHRCLVAAAMVQVAHILHGLHGRVPMVLHSQLELVDPKDSWVQHYILLGRILLGRSRGSLQARRWMVRLTTLA